MWCIFCLQEITEAFDLFIALPHGLTLLCIIWKWASLKTNRPNDDFEKINIWQHKEVSANFIYPRMQVPNKPETSFQFISSDICDIPTMA